MTLLTRSRGRQRFFNTPFSPSDLFLGGVQGAWYDPSDMTTLFQDSAGTTPVTAVEQPVGRILDKSGRGNHATQSTAASRPVLRARYNLLTYSEDFGNAAWILFQATVATNATTAPDGTLTADKLQEDNTVNPHSTYQLIATGSQSYTFTFYAKAAERSWVKMRGFAFDTYFDVANGTVGSVNPNATASIAPAGNGWYRCSVTCATAASNVQIAITTGNGVESYQGVAGNGVYIWGAQLLTAADAAATGNAYQRIEGAATYATGGVFRPYLAFDGVDDRLQTASVNIASNAVSLFAGHSIQTAGGWGSIVASGAIGGGGVFLMISDTTGAAAYQKLRSEGTLASQVTSSTFAYPYLDVWTMQAQISTDTLIARRNGAQTATSSSDQGSGSYASNIMYVGSYNGANSHYPGRIYGLIVRGAASSAVEVAQTESWLNAKTGAY